MNNFKKKIFIFTLILLFFLFFSKNFTSYLKKNLNEKDKSKIRRLIVNLKNRDFSDYTIFEIKRSKYLDKKEYNKKFLDNKENVKAELILKKKINSFLKMKIQYFELPLNNYKNSDMKPVAFLDVYMGYIFIVSGDGQIFKIKKNNFDDKNILIQKVNSNLYDLINNPLIKEKGEFSIKSILIDQNELFISFTSMPSDNCYSMKVIKSNLLNDTLHFKNFFNPKECVSKEKGKEFSALQTGGKMIAYKDDKILINIGEYRNRPLAQDANSIFGKVLIVNKSTQKYEILSMGHRNQLGMFFDEQSKTLIMSEMGPKGGDEININKNLEKNMNNYGWPISSYGEHYSQTFKPNAPLHKSHKKFGYLEPIKYWNPSVSPSQIKKVSFLNKKDNQNILLMSTLGWRSKEKIKIGNQSLHFLIFNSDYSKLNDIKVLNIKERVRDFLIIDNKKIIFIFESIPAIGLASIKGKL